MNELISADLGPLVEDRSQWGKNRERFGNQALGSGANGAPVGGEGGPGAEGGQPADGAGGRFGGGRFGERRKWPEEKVLINLESLRNFNVRAKVVGPGVSLYLSPWPFSSEPNPSFVLFFVGFVRQAHSSRDRYEGSDQRSWLWFLRSRDRPRV